MVLEDIERGIYTHVAIVDANVVGTIGGTISESSVSEIYVFYIDEAYRYKGIGTKLLNAFTKEHLQDGAIEQYASVEEGNALGIPFYKSRDFKQRNQNKRFWRRLTN